MNNQNDQPPDSQHRSNLFYAIFFVCLGLTNIGVGIWLYRISFVTGALTGKDSPPPLQFFTTTVLSLLVLDAIIIQILIYIRMSAQNERLIKASERSAEVARDAFYIGERAHFGVHRIHWQNTGRQNETSLMVTFLNGGRSPAWHFETSATLYIGTDFNNDGRAYKMQIRESELSQTFIPAGEKVTVNYVSKDFPQLADLYGHFESHHADELFVHVHAIYRDFNSKRQDFDHIAIGGKTDGIRFEDITTGVEVIIKDRPPQAQQ